MEKMLDENVTKQVVEFFAALEGEVGVLFFGSDDPAVCEYCSETHQLLEEVTALSDKVSLQSYDLEKDAELAGQYKVEAAPTFVIVAKDGDQLVDYGVRYKGIPAGHEFTSLVNSLLIVSKRDSGLNPKTREFLKGLGQPVHLQVFVTPTCPYCPRAVVLAHQMALESPMVEAEMVEATEFPELSNRFNVSGVPQTTINMGAENVVGAAPEDQMIAHIQRALTA
jgi:glutaredoxin-like protein